MSNDVTYSTKELEARIDRSRLEKDWIEVCHLVERYAHVFDVGAVGAAVSTNKSRSFYWVVMAEIMIYHNINLEKALYCVSKSATYDGDAMQWRIVLVKVLLKHFQDVFSSSLCEHSKTGFKDEGQKEKERNSSGVDDTSFLHALQSFSPDHQHVIKKSISNLYGNHKNALMSALSCLSAGEVSLICQEVLTDMQRQQLSAQHILVSRIWLLALCRQIISGIHLGDTYQRYVDKKISEYSLWQHLDAVMGRAAMNEMSDNLHQARGDLMAVIRLVKTYAVPINHLPSFCRNVVLAACCRLPFLERKLQLYSEAIASFHCCVSTDSALTMHIPVPLQIALCIEAGEMMLGMSCASHLSDDAITAQQASSSALEEKASPEPITLLEDSQLHVDNAHALLLTAKRHLSSNPAEPIRSNDQKGKSNVDADHALDQTPSVAPHSSSMQWLLPVTSSDPDEVVQGISPARLAVSLAAASLKADLLGRGAVVQEAVSVLEWGVGAVTEPTLELLWNLGVLYVCLGKRVKEGVDLMCQCIPMSAALSTGIDACSITGVSSVADNSKSATAPPSDLLPPRRVMIEWLGLGPQPTVDRSMLCALAASQVFLNHLGDPKRAIQAAFLGLRSVGSVGTSVIRAIELFAAPVSDNVPMGDIDRSADTEEGDCVPRDGIQRSRSGKLDNIAAASESSGSPRYFGSIYDNSPLGYFFRPDSLEKSGNVLGRNASIVCNYAPSGVYSLVLMIIRSYAAWARDNTLLPLVNTVQRDDMRSTALRLCKFLESDDLTAALLTSEFTTPSDTHSHAPLSPIELGRLTVEMAVLLGEVGEISESIRICREYLHAETHHNLEMIPVLHVLSFLLTCTKGDEQVATMAMSLCAQALHTAEHMVHAVGKPHRRKIQKLKKNISQYGNTFDVYHSFTRLDVANIQLSLARMKWSVGSKEQAVRLTDEMVAILTSPSQNESEKDNADSKKGFHTVFDVVDHFERTSFQELTMRVRLFTGASQVYRLVENFPLAQYCVEEAWRSLYSFHTSCVPSESRLHHDCVAQGGVAALLAGKNLTRPDNLVLNSSWEIDSTSENGLKVAADLSETAWINLLREVPTIRGWKLTEGTGWASTVPRTLEAEVLSECAEISYSEGDSTVAMDLLSLALSVHPQHTRSMLCLASIELNAVSKLDQKVTSESREGLERAYHFCRRAVDLKSLSTDAWHTLGRALEAMELPGKACDAYVTSLECQQYSPMREFADALF